MHVSTGAFAVNVFMSIVSLAATVIWLLMWRHARCGYMLLLCAGWAGLCLYWSLIAVSAGSNPVWSRADLALAIRAVLLVSGAVLVWGKIALLRTAWRYSAGRNST